jgi:hypothetical protein
MGDGFTIFYNFMPIYKAIVDGLPVKLSWIPQKIDD